MTQTCNICNLNKDFSCFAKDKKSSSGFSFRCKSCRSSYGKEHYKRNKDTIKAREKQRYLEKSEYIKTRVANWKKENSEKVNAGCMKRHSAKLLRTPKWLLEDDYFLFEEAYSLAKLRKGITGFAWEVDHIYPLQGETISGLHIPINLQVVPKSWNASKGNKMDINSMLYFNTNAESV